MSRRQLAAGLLALSALAGCAESPPASPPAVSAPAATSGKPAAAPPPSPSAVPTAAGETAPPPGEAPATAGLSDEDNIFFARSHAEVDEAGRQKLLRHVQRLKADPKLRVTLVGHTDDLGSRSYNLAIVEQRIEAVYRLLRAEGVPIRQLRRYGVGAERNGQACRSPECRRRMRRVELIYRK